MAVKFSNNASTTLASAINTTATSITVTDASSFPTLGAGDYTYVTLDADTIPASREVVKVTAIGGNVLTVVRGQDGTSATAFDAGVEVELRLTAALLNDVADLPLSVSTTTASGGGTLAYSAGVFTFAPADLSSYATQAYVDTAVADLVDSAPAALDTLNELAAALGDDANFSTTVTNSIATKWTQDNTKISNWDTAYSWGDHSSVGYITDLSSFTTTDLTEGTNLYYTDERVDDRVNTLIQAGLGITTSYDDINNELTIESDTIEELCKNATASTILKGTPVYQTGTSGNAMEIAPADAGVAAKMPAVGVLGEDLIADAEGSLILMGRISGIDTSSFSEGDTIFVNSGGGYTNTKPTGQSVLIQNLGRVTKVHASSGGGVVMGAGRSNDVPNLTDGNVFIGNASGSHDKRALVAADISDVTATATEINYLSGVTSSVQTQLDALQASDTDLSAIAALTPSDSTFIVGNGTSWVSETGATVRASLGLTIGTDVQAYDANTVKYDDATANFTGTLQNAGSNVLVDSDIGSTVQAYDATIVVDADIGVTVQGYDANTTTATNTQTLTNKTVEALVLNNGYTEETHTLTGTDIDQGNGSFQLKVLASATTFTESLASGQSVILHLEGGSTYTVTWPTITWVTSDGNNAPTLTAKDTLILWKISSTLYGAYVGSYV